MTDHDPHQLLSGYALDALDPEDRARFEEHLDSCDDCRRELSEFGPAISELSALSDTAPPPQLRTDVLTAIGQVRQEDPVPAHGEQPVPLNRARPGRGRLVRSVTALIGAAALVAAVALGGWAWGRHRLAEQQRADGVAISRVLSAPDARTYRQTAPNGMRMTYIVSEQRNAALAVPSEVTAPGVDRTYQLWTVTVRGGDKVFRPDRTFAADAGPILLTGDIRSTAAVGVTLEPEGGSSTPTGDPFAVQSL
ncbi:anti-sigma factor [Microlunatus soli]|uniref:Regulator of SigK n=1 Tax=Microlunatus soli TaxID=630515 RepID=A0A1H1YEE6_9ACTN|nr:anti-sigma factor [Microlunatus soli]SDT19898.1 Putative zinc-finger [Microlunatus soli]